MISSAAGFSLEMGVYELVQGEENEAREGKNENRLLLDVEGGYGVGGSESTSAKTVTRSEDAEDSCSMKMKGKSEKVERHQMRLVSLDVFRGITVMLMVFVDDAGGLFPSINHSPWNGVTLADFVMPFFLFIVGVALVLAYKRVSDRGVATRKAILRALKLLVVGLVLQGGYFHGLNNLTYGVDMFNIRWMGVLQRIAIAYLVAALCEIWLRNDETVDSGLSMLRKYRWQLLLGLLLTLTYIILLYGLFVPDWEYQVPSEGPQPKTFLVKCGVRGDTRPGCNSAGMIDRMVLGIEHLYRRPVYVRTEQCSSNSPNYGPLPSDAPAWCQAPFDPEGLLSSVMAIVTCLIGLQFGHVILHFKDNKVRIMQWMMPSFCLLALAFSLDFFGLHMNKALYSISYTLVTAGAAGILFTGVYVLVDVYGYRRPTVVIEWIGTHALMIYVLLACNVFPVLIQGFYWGDPKNNILHLVGIGV